MAGLARRRDPRPGARGSVVPPASQSDPHQPGRPTIGERPDAATSDLRARTDGIGGPVHDRAPDRDVRRQAVWRAGDTDFELARTISVSITDERRAALTPHRDRRRSGSGASPDGRPRGPRQSAPRRAPDGITPVGADGLGTGVSPGIRTVYGLLIVLLLGYAVSLVVRGANGASPTWLDGWGASGFELLASMLVVMRGITRPRDRPYTLWLGLGCAAWALGDFRELSRRSRRDAGDLRWPGRVRVSRDRSSRRRRERVRGRQPRVPGR